MHDNDQFIKDLHRDVTTILQLMDAVERAETPEEKAAAQRALDEEGRRQQVAGLERLRQSYRDQLELDGILRASATSRPSWRGGPALDLEAELGYLREQDDD
ncbi:hypothetical protein [Nonomuraea sp. 10N515B]|uniref:hypothetical protein n=1 Tax=Nonomuraea sp. 10N515B TaxID=3457422 RepID=UPI003FCC3ACB